MEQQKVCNCPHHKVAPWMMIIVGLAFVVYALGTINFMTMGLIVGIGLFLVGFTKLTGHSCKCCK